MSNKKIKIVGITGLMGSGKSYISGLFSTHGVLLCSTDIIAQLVCIKNTDLRKILIDKFGEQYYDGININKLYVRSLYFDDSDESRSNLKWANETIGPYVKEYLNTYISNLTDCNTYVLIESAILFESGLNEMCDVIIGVRAPNACVAAITRDNITREEWKQRMSTLLPESEKTFDFIINNNYTPDVNVQVEDVHKKILLKK